MSTYSHDTAMELLNKARTTLEAYSAVRNLFLRGKRLFKSGDKKLFLEVSNALKTELEPYVFDSMEPGLSPKQHAVFMKIYSDMNALSRSLELRVSLTRESVADKLQYDRDLQAATFANLMEVLIDQEIELSKGISLDLQHEGVSGIGE